MIAASTPAPDAVVLVHGFAGKRLWMIPLCARLRSQGFRVSNWAYASLLGSLEQHATRLYQHLTTELAEKSRVHLVAHSMGAIVVRTALSMGPVANLGRVVLIAPPNSGSPVARIAGRLVGRICQPIAELSDHGTSYVNKLPVHSALDIAVIAGRFDVLIPIANTHLAGEREHIVLNATHNSLLFSRVAASLASSFLSTGRMKQVCGVGVAS